MKPLCLDKPHQNRISPLFSHPSLPFTLVPLLLPPFNPTPHSFLQPPPPLLYNSIWPGHTAHWHIVRRKGRNDELLPVGVIHDDNYYFPPHFSQRMGPESGGVVEPPLWAVRKPAVITYHRWSRGPRLNADENEMHSFWFSCFSVWMGLSPQFYFTLSFPFISILSFSFLKTAFPSNTV